jgi:nuclear pore complex protein Nup205
VLTLLSRIGLRDGSVFSQKVDTLVESLEASLLLYMSTVTRKRADSNGFRPVLRPSFKHADNTSAGNSLGTLSAFLADQSERLAERLQDSTAVGELLADFDSKPIDVVEDLFEFPHGGDDGDRRARIKEEMKVLHSKQKQAVASSLRASPSPFPQLEPY